jgi:3-carboxy-cis,cis-muconate cycloisomerase
MTNPLLSSSMLTPLFSSAAMRRIVDDRAKLQHMLDFEVALAGAEAATGIIPATAVAPITQAARPELYDCEKIGAAGVAAGNIAIPFVKALTEEVGKINASAARYVHWGATSQDVIDTATALELRAGIDALLNDLDRAIAGFARLARQHREQPTVARTWLQHALPMPFGLKLAGYAAALHRSRARLREIRKSALVLQFGGAGGTLAALGRRGIEVSERLAASLDLRLPDAPWHSHRDRLGEIAAALAILAGTCGKIGRDVALLMQTEVGEAHEPAAPGRGGSSSMPQKRNPTASAAAIACAHIAPQLCSTILAAEIQEHERAAGAWAAEWPTFPALLLTVSGGLAAIVDIAEGLEVDGERMRANMAITGGQIMAEAISVALAAKIGKRDAHRLVEEASRKSAAGKKDLFDVLAQDARVTAQIPRDELKNLFEPAGYQGAAQAFIARQLAALDAAREAEPDEENS